jgi:cleavage and polyadenylation specificity factor subunit 3
MQELLLILEDYWERNPDLRGVPIYQASGLARKALSIFQTYIEMMNEDIKAAFDQVALPLRLQKCSRVSQSAGELGWRELSMPS